MVKQAWGGPWTEEKLERVRKYLSAYTTALKRQPFSLLYIDAFAGSGMREIDEPTSQSLLDLEGIDRFVQGSARMALETHPPFSRFTFVEKTRSKFHALQTSLNADYASLIGKMEFRNQDANTAVKDICATTNWHNTRAVAFLDPYGMQVEWSTISAIAGTRGIDMWYLFPAGIGVGRMVPRRAERQPETWARRLDLCLGGTDWREIAYEASATQDLFEPTCAKKERIFSISSIEKYVREKLEQVFPGVAEHALPLSKRNGAVMYLLFFACANERGAPTALKIANSILGAKRGKRHRD
ncbi:three-Cys-motif partner protein TcmP [Hypericibacter sp.]|uniref:three-Cys-motif partner protein TcmP n=1 Tax=Hypericibacter sp. TaxID=2705401 RepID=UPI003D6D68C2